MIKFVSIYRSGLIQKAKGLFDFQQDGAIQVELIKMIVEHNREYIFDYDCASDTATMYEICNGKMQVKASWEQYYAKNMFGTKIYEEDRQAFKDAISKCIEEAIHTFIDVRYCNNEGEYEWNRVYLVSKADNNGKVTKVAGRFMSIHNEKIASEIVRMEAERDSLTGIYNHKNYEILCKQMIEDENNDVLFMMIDMDDFKQINDKKGHYVGDVVLKRVAEVLSTETEGRGIAGRMGGDEFSVCLIGIDTKDKAMAVALSIKDALKTEVEGVTFTVSMGGARTAGRKLDFNKLYFEADEAVYFSKENGKNQITLREDMEEKERELVENDTLNPNYLEAELGLDQREQYQVIIDPDTKKILYVNKSAREVMGVKKHELDNVHCYELFKNSCTECKVCNLLSSYVNVAGKNECGLSRYIPNGNFIIQSKYMPWKGKPARVVSFFDVNDKQHVEECFLQEMESQDTFSKCWELIMDSPTQEVDYNSVLKILNDYYASDCILIAPYMDGKYKGLYEAHKENAEKIIEAFRRDFKLDIFKKLHAFYNTDGFLMRRRLLAYIEEHPETKATMESYYIHNVLGIKLIRRDQFVGQLLVINPRHHVNDYEILNQINVFFITDLLRRNLLSDKEYARTHDILTRLWNRNFFTEWQMKYGHLVTNTFGVFTADIVNLKKINKEFGYDYGNKKIVEVAELFQNVFSGYSIFRFDDDQVLAICHATGKEMFTKLVAYAQESIEEIGFPVACGFAWTNEIGILSMIQQAEELMEHDRIRIERQIESKKGIDKRVEADIQQALANGNFRVFLQPKTNLYTETTIGAEALIRLFDKEHGMVSPAVFIPILEKYHAVYMIDLFVLKNVFIFQREALNKGRKLVPISVNFSKDTMLYEGLLDIAKKWKEEYPILQGMIRIEITETISNMEHFAVSNVANGLKELGFLLCMDDFGTQYSNMSVLTQFDFEVIKIDRSIIQHLEGDEKSMKILKHMLAMMRDLGSHVVVEGVETRKQAEILKGLGCEEVQGFLFGRPEPMEEFYERFM